MTAPPDVEQPPAVDTAWDERPIVGQAKGLPWWAAVLLAFAVATIAAWIDMRRGDSLGRLYQGAYVLGCVIAVCAVRRRNLFGPMVQPPLVFAVTAIGAVVISQPGPLFSPGLKQLVLSVALPLTSNFPTMAVTTGVTVAIGLARLWFQRNPYPNIRSNRSGPEPDPLDPVDLLDGRDRPPRPSDSAPRPRDRGSRTRGRAEQDPAPGSATRRRSEQDPGATGRARPDRDRGRGRNRSDNWDQPPPRPTRGRTDPPLADRPQRGERSETPPPDQRRRPQPDQPRRDPSRRRRPPPEDYR